MNRDTYSETTLCACGCGMFARAFGQYRNGVHKWNAEHPDGEPVVPAPKPKRRRKSKQPSLFDAPNPSTGVFCKTCDKELQHYDVARGECFPHIQTRLIAWRKQPVRATQAAQTAEGD